MTPSDLLAPPPKRLVAMPDQAPLTPTLADPGATPEDILRAVFLQALTGQLTALPEGASVAALREALVLDPAISARIFSEAKAQAGTLDTGLLPQPSPAVTPAQPDPAQRPRRVKFLAAGAAGLAALAIAAFFALHRPAQPTAELFTAAATSPAAYGDLLARAKSGDPQAEFALAALLDRRFAPHETVAPKNDALAFEWYTQSASAGFAPAEQALGFAYLNGHGVTRDPVSAVQYYQQAAAQGLPMAENALGFMYLKGIGVPQDYLHAVNWFTRAALQNLPAAENNLGNAYESGTGVTQDNAQAAIWFTRAAAQGEPNAQNSLGYLYFNGLGVKRDVAKSAALFTAAAKAGNPAAEVNLGLSYANGAGVPKNPVTAATWCYKAQAAGAKGATAALALITPQLTPPQITAAQAEAAQ